MSGLAFPIPAELVEAIAVRVAELVLERLPAPAAVEPWHLLSVEDAAARLGRSTRWVRERAKRGELAHVRLDGGALAFDPDDLRRFARERRIACTPLAPDENRLHLGEFSSARLRDVQKAGSSAAT